MRSKEVSEAISDLVNTKENRLYDEIDSNDIKSIETVLDYIEELEIENINVRYQYDLGYKACEIEFINKIRDKIEVLRKKQLNEYNNYGYTEDYYHLTSMIAPLKELLEGE